MEDNVLPLYSSQGILGVPVVGYDIAYLGRIVEYPSEVGIISERSLHTLYGIWDVGLG